MIEVTDVLHPLIDVVVDDRCIVFGAMAVRAAYQPLELEDTKWLAKRLADVAKDLAERLVRRKAAVTSEVQSDQDISVGWSGPVEIPELNSKRSIRTRDWLALARQAWIEEDWIDLQS